MDMVVCPPSPHCMLEPFSDAVDIHMVYGVDPGQAAMFTAVGWHGNTTACPSKVAHTWAKQCQHEDTVARWHANALHSVQCTHIRVVPVCLEGSIIGELPGLS